MARRAEPVGAIREHHQSTKRYFPTYLENSKNISFAYVVTLILILFDKRIPRNLKFDVTSLSPPQSLLPLATIKEHRNAVKLKTAEPLCTNLKYRKAEFP